MNLIGIFLCIFLIVIVSIVFIYFLASKFILGPYAKYKRNTRFLTMEEIVSSITSVCNLQFKLYDDNRFREAGPKLDNSSFDNYHNELSKKCINSLSDEFYNKASMYMTEESIAIMISEYVRNYLTTKIGIDDSANDMDEEE